MALVVKDRVKESTTSTGTGTITLAGTFSGFQDFSAIGDGNTTYYTITDGTNWEVGIGTYTSSGTTLSRDTVLESSNSGSLVDFPAGTKDVFVTYPAERSVYVDGSTIVPAVTATLPVSSGGSGTNSLTGVLIGNGTSAFSTKTNPSGDFVGTTDTQTLTNKTSEKLILNDGYTEEVFAITDGSTVDLDPNNGSIQTWTLGANRTPGQANWNAGQSITLMVDDGTDYTITWSTLAVVWKTNNGNAPTLNTTGFTVIVLWKVGATIYGARVGDA
jgi:hypothetical protein